MFDVKNPDRLRYQPNRPSFLFCLLAIVFNIGALVVAYTDKGISPNVVIGIDVMMNILFMLVCFMASEKTKAYSAIWGKAVIGIGIGEILRILIVPVVFLANGQYTTMGFLLNVLFLVLAGICLIFAGLICLRRAAILKAHLIEIGELS